MKTDQKHIDKIREGFHKISRKEDFLALLNSALVSIYGEATKPIKMNSLHYYANPNHAKKRYTEFVIKKKSGGDRKIHAPVSGLMSIQKGINFILQCLFEPHKAVTGFVPGKSIVDNAKAHTNMHYVYNIDLKDFFPSIDLHRVKAVLKLKPFNLNDGKEPIAFMIANLCCENLEVERLGKAGNWVKEVKPVLPQGSPCSPVITNIIAQRLDRRLNGLAKKHGVRYTRYADDITFSSLHNVYQQDSDFLKEMKRLIEDEHFTINEAKTRMQKNVYRQEVTGLIVNEKPNVHRRYIKQLRMWLYYWEKYGYIKAEQIFLRDYTVDKGHVKNGNPGFTNVLSGKLEFLKMVKGDQDPTYVKLHRRFVKLLIKLETISINKLELESILETWESKGIESAIELYNKYKIGHG